MAKIAAAYIAHGRFRETRRVSTRHAADFDPELIRSWQRLYCLFRILKQFNDPLAETKFFLFADHAPPRIGDCLIGRYFEQLGVEIVRSDYYWRPDMQPERPDFFIFDTIEQLAARVDPDDHILLFGPQALVVHHVAPLFDEIDRNDVLLIEASVGEVSEPMLDAYRAEIGLVRQAMNVPNPPDAIMAVDPHFLGLTGKKLADMNRVLRRFFPKNELRAVRGDAFLSEPGEVLAALLAELGFLHANLKGLTDEVAAMPDEFDVLNMKGAPLIIPGYGREPDISLLFQSLILDSAERSNDVDPFTLLRNIAAQSQSRSAFKRLKDKIALWFGPVRYGFQAKSVIDRA